MKKSFRLFAAAAILSLAASPSVRAERLGTNPHPPTVDSGDASPSLLDIVQYTVLISYGI